MFDPDAAPRPRRSIENRVIHAAAAALTCALCVTVVLPVPSSAQATTSDAHAQHHAAGGAGPAPDPGAKDMMGDMGRMMESHGRPPQKELYPALMELPDLPPEQRQEVAARARGRMSSGLDRVSSAVAALASAAERHDYAAMQQATEGIGQGLAEFDSGLAAERALVEGQSPRNVALRWFKREMHLPVTPYEGEQRTRASGFHYFAMLVLGGCAAILGAVQMARIRRARELADRLAPAVGRRGPVVTPETAATTGRAVAAQAHEPVVTQVPSTTGAWSGQLRIARIFQETPTTKTFRLAPLLGENLPFTFEPGQFLAVGVAVDGRQVKRSYSIASSPCCQGWCEITVRHVTGGAVSAVLHERMQVGDTIDVAGPFGRFTFRGREASSVVMIAGGVGITPLMSSIRFLTDQSWAGDIYLVYGTSQLDEVIFREELDYLAKRHPNLHVTISLSAEPSRGWTGARGRITRELLQASIPELAARRVHVCGPPPMMDAMKAALAELGVPSDAVKTELFLSPEVKEAPLVPAPSGVPSAATCTFARSEKKAPLPPERTILEVAEEIEVAIDYSCRQGFCGACKVRLLGGHVSMAVDDGLSSSEKTGGWILACQAKSEANVSVDA
jgi:ferredoxin-NADP reductase